MLFRKIEGKDFSYFSYFFAGYAESVVNEIIKKHKNQKYISTIYDNEDDEVSLKLSLKNTNLTKGKVATQTKNLA
jgi:hypothetical protein